jgi:hypothetical protein
MALEINEALKPAIDNLRKSALLFEGDQPCTGSRIRWELGAHAPKWLNGHAETGDSIGRLQLLETHELHHSQKLTSLTEAVERLQKQHDTLMNPRLCELESCSKSIAGTLRQYSTIKPSRVTGPSPRLTPVALRSERNTPKALRLALCVHL